MEKGAGLRAQGGRTACGERLAAKAQGAGLAVLPSCGLF